MDAKIISGFLGIDMHNDHAQKVEIKTAIGDIFIITEDEEQGVIQIEKVGDAPKHMILFPTRDTVIQIA